MRVLFLRTRQELHHSFDTLKAVMNGNHVIEALDPDAPVCGQFAGVDVVVDPGGAVGTREMIDAAQAAGVKLWQVTTNGLDHVDVEYFLENDVPLASCPGPSSAVPLAEHAIWLILCFAKQLGVNRTSEWSRSINEELNGKTLGIVGLGASGRELARLAGPFGMRILAFDAMPQSVEVLEELNIQCVGGPDGLEALLRESDFVSLHLPLTRETRHIIDRPALASMKRTAVVVNVARGALIEEEALIEALDAGSLKGAALDVFETEPLPADHPFHRMSNVMTTPHMAGFTTGTWRRRVAHTAENIERVAAGLPPNGHVTSTNCKVATQS
jgi:D-3-phosphoglycerate dehydrogenase